MSRIGQHSAIDFTLAQTPVIGTFIIGFDINNNNILSVMDSNRIVTTVSSSPETKIAVS